MKLALASPNIVDKVKDSQEGAKDRVLSSIQDVSLKVTSPFRNGIESYRKHLEAKLLMESPDALTLIRSGEGASNLIFSREEIDQRTGVRRSFRLSISGKVPFECEKPLYFVSLNSESDKTEEARASVAKKGLQHSEKILEDKARRILVELPDIVKLDNGGFDELKNSLNGGVKVNLEDRFFDSAGGDDGWVRIVSDNKVTIRAHVLGFTVDVSRSLLPDGDPCFCASVLAPDLRPEVTMGVRSRDSRALSLRRLCAMPGSVSRQYQKIESPLVELMSVGGSAIAGIFNRLEGVAFDNMLKKEGQDLEDQTQKVSAL